jgi:hypothetical protein
MAKAKKRAAGPKAPAFPEAPRTRSWSPTLYLNPGGETPGFTYGVLRKQLRQRELGITASEFVRRKLYPVDLPPEGCWTGRPTCLRYDVLLPPGAVDGFMDIQMLVSAYDRFLPSWRKGLACVLKVPQPMNEPIQASYERIRFAARNAFAIRRNLPSLVIAHAPFLAGSDRGPHCHVVALGAAAGLLGFTSLNDEVTSDAGHLALYREFQEAGAVA